MDFKAYVDDLVAKAKTAQMAIENYSQEQTDALVKAVGKIVFDNREMLSKEAVDETEMGVYESKVRKHGTLGVIWNYMKDKKSVGVIEDDTVNRVITIAKPMGVVGCIAPSTNPTTTPAFNTMIALKGRNAAIIAPHPRSRNCTAHTVKLMRGAIEALGAPPDLIQVLEEPTIEITGYLMSSVDVIVATGGLGMVKASYSSGRPSFGVGQGNEQVIVDEDYDDLELITENILINRVGDNGMPCTGEQMMYLPRARKDEIIEAFRNKNCHIINDPKVVDSLRTQIFKDGILNRNIVGKPPSEALAIMGIDIPKDTRLLFIELTATGKDEILCREIMFPVVRYIAYDEFEDAVARAKENLLEEGAGHSSIVYSNDRGRIEYAGDQLPVGRLLVAQPGNGGSACTYFNGLPPTLSVGCGSWGNNSICENLTYKHLLNFTKITYPIADAYVPTYEETWG